MIHTRGPSTTGMSRRSRVSLFVGFATGAACALAGLAFVLVAPLPGSSAEARTVGRGIIDYRLERPVVDLKAVPDMVAEMGQTKLRSRWTRILVHWATMQPVAPGTSYAADNKADAGAERHRRTFALPFGEQTHVAHLDTRLSQGLVAAACSSDVTDRRIRHEHAAQPELPGSATEVLIFRVEEETFVEAADPLEKAAPAQERGTPEVVDRDRVSQRWPAELGSVLRCGPQRAPRQWQVPQ